MMSKTIVLTKLIFFAILFLLINVNTSSGVETSQDKNVLFYPKVDSIGFVTLEPPGIAGYIIDSKGESIIYAIGNTVYLNIKEGVDLKIGDELFVVKISKKIEHPISKEKLYHVTRILGQLQITGIEGGLFRSRVIKSYTALSIGDEVMLPLEPMDKKIRITMPDRKIEGYIIGNKDENEVEIVEQDVIYIDRGEKDGVKKGNTFIILKEGKETRDPTTKEEIKLPSTTVGKGVVLFTTPHTSTALVVNSISEFEIGVKIMMTNN